MACVDITGYTAHFSILTVYWDKSNPFLAVHLFKKTYPLCCAILSSPSFTTGIHRTFQIKQNAKTHPHTFPVLSLTTNISFMAINTVIKSMIPQKSICIGWKNRQIIAQVIAS